MALCLAIGVLLLHAAPGQRAENEGADRKSEKASLQSRTSISSGVETRLHWRDGSPGRDDFTTWDGANGFDSRRKSGFGRVRGQSGQAMEIRSRRGTDQHTS